MRLLLLSICAGMLGSATLPPVLGYDLGGLGDRAMPVLAYDLSDFARGEIEIFVVPPPVERASPAEETIAPTEDTTDRDMRLLISLPQQKVYVFSGEDLLATSPVSTGKPGHATPIGTFHIMEKQLTHRSNRYSNAPMPYMQRLTSSGIALHAGRLPGYAASHGCIRLPWSFARRLYGMTDPGTVVVITRVRPRSANEARELT